MITLKNISKDYSGHVVLSEVSVIVGPHQKVALVGPNGCGKSTLLRIITGMESPDSGTVEITPGYRVGYLPQEIKLDEVAHTIEEYLKEITGIGTIERQIDELGRQSDKPENTDKLLHLQEQFGELGGYEFDYQTAKILAGFGLTDISVDRKIVTLSGGQKTKVALAGVLLQGVDILLLDEPTNNLDLAAIIWLENFIAKSKAICIIVSHDRRFLDKIVGRVYEIDWFSRNVVEFTGNYSSYIAQKMARIEREQREYEQGQSEIQRLLKSASEKRQWGAKGSRQETRDNDKFIRGTRRDRASRSDSKAKALEQQVETINLVKPTKKREPTIFPLKLNSGEGDRSISLQNVIAGYDTDFRIGPLNMRVDYGKRIGIVGPNGCGKSTLLKIITGELKPIQGTITISPAVVLGNLMQYHENIPRNDRAIEVLMNETGCDLTVAYHVLANFNFSTGDAKKLISDFSPGERARIVLALFALMSANVLILDEPTNHLDVDAISALESVLSRYEGSIIFVSHDRYFLETVKADQLLLLESGKVREIYDYETYVQTMMQANQSLY